MVVYISIYFPPSFFLNSIESVLPFLMDFMKKDFCSVFVIVNSHCCCCSQKDCINEVRISSFYIGHIITFLMMYIGSFT